MFYLGEKDTRVHLNSGLRSSLRPVDGVLIAADLKFNAVLTSLDLCANEIGAGGAKAIADSLPQS